MAQRSIGFAALSTLVAAIVVKFIYRGRFDVDSLAALISTYGTLAPLVFLVIRVIGAVVLIPGSLMAIAAGVAFGFLPGARI